MWMKSYENFKKKETSQNTAMTAMIIIVSLAVCIVTSTCLFFHYRKSDNETAIVFDRQGNATLM